MKKFELGPIQKAWIKSLREHPERQMKRKLGFKNPDGTYTACCLGELLICANLATWGGNVLKDGKSPTGIDEHYEQLGLRSGSGRIKNHFGIDTDLMHLSNMNDSGKTWPEIADIVEANPEDWFTKSV